jgi:antitoxin component of RelBE/YafQ-DinJ toxin-antitoxin module
MSAEELDRHFSQLILENRQRQRAISIRFPEDLLDEIRELAQGMGVGYQTLIKSLLERDVARLRRQPIRRRSAVSNAMTTKRQTSKKLSHTAKLTRSSSAKTPGKQGAKSRPRELV